MITAAEIYCQWLEFKSVFVCDRTLKWYRPTADSLHSYFGDKLATEIKKIEIAPFIQFLKAQNVSSETVRRKLEAISACWDWAIDCELISPKNPWKGMSKLIMPSEVEEPKPFTYQEVLLIFDGFEKSENYNQLLPFVKFLFLSGVRTGEAIGLRWGDVSKDCKVITVRSQLTRGTRKKPKNGKLRKFQSSQEVIDLLLAIRPFKPLDDQLVFTWNSKAINDSNFLRRPWKKILADVGVIYRKPYNTRHTFISHCLENGSNPVLLGQVCGNSPRVIFSHYAGAISPLQLPKAYSTPPQRIN